MNSKHVQTFLLVSAAFFAMSAPVRSNSAPPVSNTAPNGVVRATEAPSRTSVADLSGSPLGTASGE
jgi:hypothetical protein